MHVCRCLRFGWRPRVGPILLSPVTRPPTETNQQYLTRYSIFSRPRQSSRRNFSTSRIRSAMQPDEKAIQIKPTAEEKAVKSRQRMKRILDKLPASMRPHAERLMNAPGSYVFTFLLIHEVTAIAPLFGLMWLFQVTDWMPPLPEGLIEAGKEFYSKAIPQSSLAEGSESATKLILQGATAFAIVKMILPLRVAFSLLITPWFARRSVIPAVNRIQMVINTLSKPKKSGIDFDKLPSRKSR
ncbi:hypothetical protein POJ06DRAFT_245166 [Lipomyces tetrasporus]|uniref:Uncharacterized protein n=1 Tax=Lipomyces tetrasporus TaxID=54092 RepID=A0AAD7QW95_9ASCO|nr:uncharacterized protein POJ06DRAFT_245166 [Lipomyces tetrasporus]KAJ8102628.1 hypothetical protein POJ06DRAFT_245166 [Lipomyces tetrasporus]